MQCPKCNRPISPFKVWLIARWSHIKCDKCSVEFGRNIDIQCWIIAIILLVPLLVLRLGLFHPFYLAWAFVVMFIDAYTIKLIPKEEVKREKATAKGSLMAIFFGIGVALAIIIIFAAIFCRP